MRTLRLLLTTVLLVLGSTSGVVAAVDERQLSGEETFRIALKAQLRAGDSLEEALERLRAVFAESDLDGGGISDSDIDLNLRIRTASQRRMHIEPWLDRDLDGDGAVTRAELEAFFGKTARKPVRSDGVYLFPTREQIAEKVAKLVDKALEVDRNRDGTVTLPELLEAFRYIAERNAYEKHIRKIAVPLALDRDGDGIVTEREFTGIVADTLEELDRDQDGALSKLELAELGAQVRELKRRAEAAQRALERDLRHRQSAAACGLPQAPEGAKVMLVGAFEGEALSTVSLGGDDEKVSVAEVLIEPGSAPLYVLLAGYEAMIWRFSGAVERVVAAVANAHKRDAAGNLRVGVTGLPKARVHIPPRSACLRYFTQINDQKSRQMARKVEILIGRKADLITARFRAGQLGLPSGSFELEPVYRDAAPLPEDSAGAEMWQQMRAMHPGGLIEIDPGTVATRSGAETYRVLAEEAGLAQLLDEGALTAVGWTEEVTVDGTQIVLDRGGAAAVVPEAVRPWIRRVPRRFLIQRPMRFPAGLSGDHAAHFVLGQGVPMPEGSALGSVVER